MVAVTKVLLLDFGSVISKSLFETLDDVENTYGLAPGTLDWRGPFAPLEDALWQSMQAGEISEREYWYTRCDQLSTLVGRKLGILDILRDSRGTRPQSCIRPQAVAAIEQARTMGCGVGILSNELELFYGPEFIAQVPILVEMDHIVDATTTQILKPDPEAYRLAQAAFDVPASDIVFVDDQIKNVCGGQAFGFACVHFDVQNPVASYAEALSLLSADTLSSPNQDVA